MAAIINGAHIVVYSKDPEADRAFFRDVLEFPAIDAGEGWLIFALPSSEAAFHPSENSSDHELYFMCDDLNATMESLKLRKVKLGPLTQQRWGMLTEIALPGGGKIGLYQPKHPTTIRH